LLLKQEEIYFGHPADQPLFLSFEFGKPGKIFILKRKQEND